MVSNKAANRTDEWIQLQGRKAGNALYYKLIADKDFDELSYGQFLLLLDEIYAETIRIVYVKKKEEAKQ